MQPSLQFFKTLPALNGRQEIAKGEALRRNRSCPFGQALKGRNKIRPVHSAPSGLVFRVCFVHRAPPGAMICRPFRACFSCLFCTQGSTLCCDLPPLQGLFFVFVLYSTLCCDLPPLQGLLLQRIMQANLVRPSNRLGLITNYRNRLRIRLINNSRSHELVSRIPSRELTRGDASLRFIKNDIKPFRCLIQRTGLQGLAITDSRHKFFCLAHF